MSTQDPLPVHPSWRDPLAPVEDHIHAMCEFLQAETAAGRHWLPARSDIFKAFTYPFDEVKVLIVGQDPYPTPGHPMGLSFSVQPTVTPLPASLNNIFKELVDDLGVPQPPNGDLTPWCEQGVALFNRVLTVEARHPGSHRKKGWEPITECAIKALAAREKPLVAILWGRDAQSVEPWLGDYPRVLSVHPSPLSARRGFFGSRPFSKTNALLSEQGAAPINWDLCRTIDHHSSPQDS